MSSDRPDAPGDRPGRIAALAVVRRSPFELTAALPPWAPRAGHAPEDNAAAVEALRERLGTVRKPDSPAVGALLLAPPGAGKTHTLGTLHHELTAEGLCTFVELPPPTDPGRPLRHLAAVLVAGLAHRSKASTQPAPLARLLARAVAAWLADEEGAGAREAVARRELKITKKWEDIAGQVSEWLCDRYPELWPPLLDVLIQYPVPAKQVRAVAWLRGDPVASDEMLDLGVPLDPPRGEADQECQAGYKIASLARLTALDRPLVIGLDQLDGEAWSQRRKALATVLGFAFDSMPNTLVVGTAHADGWPVVAKSLDAGLASRLEECTISLAGCSRSQLEAMISRRLAAGIPGHAGDLFPLDDPLSRHQLMDLALGRPLAGDVLRKARQMWAREVAVAAPPTVAPVPAPGASAPAPPPDPVTRQLGEWLEARLRLCSDDVERFPPEDGIVLWALSLALEHAGREAPILCEAQFKPTGKATAATLEARLRTRAGIYRYRFMATLRREPSALAEPIFAALRLVGEGELDIPILIRDFRGPVPDYAGWPGGRSPVEALLAANGYLIQLDRNQIGLCWALKAITNAVAAGELEAMTPDGELTPINKAELKAFLTARELFPKVFASLAACAARVRDRRAKP